MANPSLVANAAAKANDDKVIKRSRKCMKLFVSFTFFLQTVQFNILEMDRKETPNVGLREVSTPSTVEYSCLEPVSQQSYAMTRGGSGRHR